MIACKIKKKIASSGYLQFWKEHPPVAIIAKLKQPKIPLILFQENIHPANPVTIQYH